MKDIEKMDFINLRHFLTKYYGVDNEDLISEFIHLSHKQLKEIVPFYGINVVRTSFSFIDREQIETGTVILVEDYYKNIAPYVNPNRKLSDIESYVERGNLDYVIKDEYRFDSENRQDKIKTRRMIKW